MPIQRANPKNPRWVIDWPDLKAVCLRIMDGSTVDFTNSDNAREARENCTGTTWRGYTTGQLERWLREGFQSGAIHGLEEFIPPIREKRKFVFNEEGDEFHFDIAAGGGDNYMSHFTKRQEIAGLALDVEIGMSGVVPATVTAAYYSWLCKIAYSIEAAGIDTEITLKCESGRVFKNYSPSITTVIRVKQENEATDFLSWSPMLSPASLRTLLFVAEDLHAEARGYSVDPGHGSRTVRDKGWYVAYLPETQSLDINCDFRAIDFPEDRMTAQLREALRIATNDVR